MTSLDLLKSIFDIVRIVDPEKKELFDEDKDRNLYSLPYINCFDSWNKSKLCSNCISIQAIKENKTKMKFEEVTGSIFLIIAAPYDQNGKTYAIELIKDITENNISEVIQKANNTDYKELIKDLNKAVVTDALTNLYNKRYIMESLPYHLNQSKYSNQNVAIVSVDIDFFKKVNDRYGHCVGDVVLQKVSCILKDEVRGDSDWIARAGGEEFLIVINDINKETLVSLSNRIRLRVENTEFKINGFKFNITISMGGTYITPDEVQSVQTIIEYTDKLLYQAKNTGRNKCIIEKISQICLS